MPIRHFEIFTGERRLIETVAVTQLKGTRLGVDGNYWLRKLLTKEPSLTAMGGVPLTLRSAVEKELEAFKQHHIQPIFVFPGLSLIRKSKPFSIEDTRPSNRATAWDFYDKGKQDAAMSKFATGGGFQLADVLNTVFHILHEHQIEYIRAPYFQWAQLADMYNNSRQVFHAIYGSDELLMFNVDKIITSLDFTKGNYQLVNKKTVLNDLQVNEDQFLDICILAGFEISPTFPPLAAVSFTFKSVQDLIKEHKTGFNAIQVYSGDTNVIKTGYIDTYCRTRCAIKYHLVMTDDGEVKPLNVHDAPNDIHEFIGYRLPDEVYYYMMRGLIGPQVINNLGSGVLIENPPLDNGETTEYRNFLLQLLSIRTQTLSLLTQPLHQFFQSRKVACLFWFDPANEHVLYHHPSTDGKHAANFLNSVYDKTSHWTVPQEKLTPHMNGSKSIDIALCLRLTADDAQAADTITQKNAAHMLKTKDEIVANVMWKLLEIRDFLTSSKHIHTVWGRALSIAVAHQAQPSLAAQEAYLTAFELIRFGVLTGSPFSKTYTRPLPDAKLQQHVTLVSRAMSLLPMSLKNTPWSGPFNRDLLVFNSFVKSLNRSYRNLNEMLTLSFFLNDLVDKERSDYAAIANSLPYLTDNNVALGLVVKSFLEQCVDNEPAQAVQSTLSLFPTCVDVVGDLLKGYGFWQGMVLGVRHLKENNKVSDELFDVFSAADAWIQPKFAGLAPKK